LTNTTHLGDRCYYRKSTFLFGRLPFLNFCLFGGIPIRFHFIFFSSSLIWPSAYRMSRYQEKELQFVSKIARTNPTNLRNAFRKKKTWMAFSERSLAHISSKKAIGSAIRDLRRPSSPLADLDSALHPFFKIIQLSA
jgi:hypothetical protein